MLKSILSILIRYLSWANPPKIILSFQLKYITLFNKMTADFVKPMSLAGPNSSDSANSAVLEQVSRGYFIQWT